MRAFAGICAAAVTPRSKTGGLDFGAAFELPHHLSRGTVDSIAPLTCAGGYPAFSLNDRIRLLVATGLQALEMGPCAVPLAARVEKKTEGLREWFRLWLPPALGLLANA
jgi:hypothetical protein